MSASGRNEYVKSSEGLVAKGGGELNIRMVRAVLGRHPRSDSDDDAEVRERDLAVRWQITISEDVLPARNSCCRQTHAGETEIDVWWAGVARPRSSQEHGNSVPAERSRLVRPQRRGQPSATRRLRLITSVPRSSLLRRYCMACLWFTQLPLRT